MGEYEVLKRWLLDFKAHVHTASGMGESEQGGSKN